ncbi:MAG: sigma-70 family RNA polymerase sigma factor [Ktedonobacteraceae bacterium]|nr:sigma-70 family RNA polymerase sigma factor [Ktedonobacteraceae bacterium]MBV8823159.1 sigma-70 family RNA polymerase sigma factor [Ktedonobacteraceae bacterium]MBV9019117.1 sigma-70 family RNA polymerase sigma factor [Ktedonobacteraceae bacterium]
MIESTLNASDTLGAFVGTVAKPAPKIRHRRSEISTGVQEISSTTRAISSPTKVDAMTEEMSDAALVEVVLNGDQDVFAVMVERYKDAVQNLAYRMLGNTTEAEDVTQEAFVRAYTQLATYKPVHKFSTWLLSIASHLAIDQLRRRRFLALPLEDVPLLEWIVDSGVGPEQSALRGERQDEIQSYLQRLPDKYRAVIVLRYWYDFSYEEIASTLNLTPPLVKARLHRARELLARYMQQDSVNEEGQVDALPRR